MGPLAAVREGLRRAARAPALVAGTFALTLLVSIPLALALRGMLAAHLGSSLMAESAAKGANYEWWQEFLGQATGLGTTFVPSIVGFAAVLLDLSNLLDHVPMATTIAGVTAAWLVLWSFLSGGVIDRLARNRATRSAGFFGACGAHFGAIARLGLLALVAYWALFAFLHPLLFEDLFGRVTYDTTIERRAFLIRLALYAAFGLVLVAVNLVVDYARVRLVVEDRRSALGALLAGGRFARRHAGTVLAVYLGNAALFLLLLLVYALVAPRAASPVAWTLAAGEIYIISRHFLKLAFYASETALFQSRLAHAAYTAAPPIVWPDSPDAESIANAAPSPLP
jgi:hypothetical protein